MKKLYALILIFGALLAISSAAYADGGNDDENDDGNDGGELEFEAVLSGANVVPACDSPAEGEGEFEYNPGTRMLAYEIEFEDLMAPDAGAHLHMPAAPGAIAKPVITIAGGGPPPAGPSTLGSPYIGTVPLTASQQADLLSGLVYLQIHTKACPGGELRGQLTPDD